MFWRRNLLLTKQPNKLDQSENVSLFLVFFVRLHNANVCLHKIHIYIYLLLLFVHCPAHCWNVSNEHVRYSCAYFLLLFGAVWLCVVHRIPLFCVGLCVLWVVQPILLRTLCFTPVLFEERRAHIHKQIHKKRIQAVTDELDMRLYTMSINMPAAATVKTITGNQRPQIVAVVIDIIAHGSMDNKIHFVWSLAAFNILISQCLYTSTYS